MALRRMDLVGLGALGLAAAVTAAVYGALPDPIATHFDLHGTPNGWMPRAIGAWLMPVFGLGVWAFVRFMARVLPRADKTRLGESTLALVAALTAIFMAAVHVLLLRVALVPGASILHGTWLAMGALWIALGMILPRVRRNPLVGVRTPWTLTSDENWARTHRVAGYAMASGGCVGILAALVGGAAAGALALVALIGSALVPAVYSLVYARRHDQGS
jgi:uncharacterized membrane protein